MIIMKITLEYSLINTEYNENPEIIEMTNIHVQTDLQTNKQADSPCPRSSGRINAVNSQLISDIWQGLLGLRINSSSHDYSLYPEQITKANILQSAGKPAPVDQGDKMSNAGKDTAYVEEMSTRNEPVSLIVYQLLLCSRKKHGSPISYNIILETKVYKNAIKLQGDNGPTESNLPPLQ